MTTQTLVVPDTCPECSSTAVEGIAGLAWQCKHCGASAVRETPAPPAPSFFESRTTYVQNRPYAAPETLSVFRCLLAEAPATGGEPFAFGYGFPGLGSEELPCVMNMDAWTDGDGWVPISKELAKAFGIPAEEGR